MRAQDDERITEPRAAGRGLARPALFALLALALVAVTALAVRELLRTMPTPGATPATHAPGGAASAPAAPGVTTPAAPGAAPAATLPPAEPPVPPLPALAQSDAEVRTTLADIVPATAHPSLAPDNLVARAAALADAFARGKLVRDKLPLPAMPGKLIVVEREERTFLDTANYARYDAVVAAFAEMDTAALARWYLRYEPLLQQAYAELGNGEARVRDAILGGIELMLAAPAPAGELELTQPAVFYKYADPALESLPESQKLLIRMGPRNRAIIVAQLQRLREALGS
jgi:Protein of unknown function (DUF3014)